MGTGDIGCLAEVFPGLCMMVAIGATLLQWVTLNTNSAILQADELPTWPTLLRRRTGINRIERTYFYELMVENIY